jgi:pimeloyl-ACP methyl ester carboxylesterase
MPELRTIDGLTAQAASPLSPTRAPLLFIHGYFATAWVFDRYLEFFSARGHPCLALNLRGRAGSMPGTDIGRTSMLEFAADASRAARELDRPIVIGHSMGGLVAQMLAERGEVRALVLMSSAPPRGISVFTIELLRRQWRYLPAILRSRPVVAQEQDFTPLVLNRIPRDRQRELFARFVPDSGRAGREMLLGTIRVDETSVRCPVFTVGGDDDHFIPLRTLRRIAQKYRSPLHVAAGHGHLLIQEPGWESIAGITAKWIDANVDVNPMQGARSGMSGAD